MWFGTCWVLCGTSSAPRCASRSRGVLNFWLCCCREAVTVWVLAIAQCGDSQSVQVMVISYLIWKNLTSYSSSFALNLHNKIRLKGVSDLNMLIQPFHSMLRQALLQLCNAELGLSFFPASFPCPKQLENHWKVLEQGSKSHPRAGRPPPTPSSRDGFWH